MIVKILTGLFLIGVCFFMIRIIYDFVKSIIEHKKTMKDLGQDINDIEHNGCSQVIKFDGNYMINPQKNNETLVSVNLDKIELEKYRRLYPFLKDKN